jgi:hypothetical protein
LVQNGDFSRGIEGWQTWGDIAYDITNGALNFGLTTGTTGATAVYQWLSYPVAANTALEGSVTLQNTGSTAKDVVVDLVNKTDWHVGLLRCTFTLPPNSSAQTYTVRGKSTAVWADTTLNIFPPNSPADNLKTIRVDDAVVRYRTDISPNGTECIAPTAPTITMQPQSQTINTGQTAALSVVASGTAPLTYQWYQGAAGDTSIPVGTNSTTFTTPAITQMTIYWVSVSNSGGSADSTDATLTVLQPPSGANDAPMLNLVEMLTVTKFWQPLIGSVHYQIQVATSSTVTTGIVFNQIVTTTTITVTLPSEGRYYWRVRGKKFVGTWGPWSAVDSFVVDVP